MCFDKYCFGPFFIICVVTNEPTFNRYFIAGNSVNVGSCTARSYTCCCVWRVRCEGIVSPDQQLQTQVDSKLHTLFPILSSIRG